MFVATPMTAFAASIQGENPPDYITLNYINESLDGFYTSSVYLITGLPGGDQYFTGANSFDMTSYITGSSYSINILETTAVGNSTPIDSNNTPYNIPIQGRLGVPPGPFIPTATSTSTATDGAISGVSTSMEWSPSGTISWTACTGTSINGLGAGNYYIRWSATSTAFASSYTTVTVPAGPIALTAAIVNLTAPVTGSASAAATTTGTEYIVGSTTWRVTGGAGLALGANFAGGTDYSVTVVLRSTTGYTFTAVPTGSITGTNGTVASSTTSGTGVGNTLTVVVDYSTTAAVPVITINTPPEPLTKFTQGYIGTWNLECVASVAPSGAPTYQWYSNKTASTTGGTSLGSANGADTSTLTLNPSLTAGTYYYYCVVSYPGATSVTSPLAKVIVFTDNPKFTTAPTIITDTSADAKFVINGNFANLYNIFLNNKELSFISAGTKYTLYDDSSGKSVKAGETYEGSTVIVLYASYLSTLKDATYRLTVDYAIPDLAIYASPSVLFTIDRTVPATTGGGGGGGTGVAGATGDYTNLAGIWIALIAAALGALYLVWRHRRQLRNQEK